MFFGNSCVMGVERKTIFDSFSYDGKILKLSNYDWNGIKKSILINCNDIVIVDRNSSAIIKYFKWNLKDSCAKEMIKGGLPFDESSILYMIKGGALYVHKRFEEVYKENEMFVIKAPELERIIARVDLINPEVRRQLQRPMVKMGIARALEKAGIKPGDRVRCGDYEWEW